MIVNCPDGNGPEGKPISQLQKHIRNHTDGKKCGHIWISQKFDKNNLPISCAKCKNPIGIGQKNQRNRRKINKN